MEDADDQSMSPSSSPHAGYCCDQTQEGIMDGPWWSIFSLYATFPSFLGVYFSLYLKMINLVSSSPRWLWLLFGIHARQGPSLYGRGRVKPTGYASLIFIKTAEVRKSEILSLLETFRLKCSFSPSWFKQTQITKVPCRVTKLSAFAPPKQIGGRYFLFLKINLASFICFVNELQCIIQHNHNTSFIPSLPRFSARHEGSVGVVVITLCSASWSLFSFLTNWLMMNEQSDISVVKPES